MPTILTDYDVWSFKRDDRGRWVWRRDSPDGELLLESRSPFDEFDECLSDARRAGYTGSFSLDSPAGPTQEGRFSGSM